MSGGLRCSVCGELWGGPATGCKCTSAAPARKRPATPELSPAQTIDMPWVNMTRPPTPTPLSEKLEPSQIAWLFKERAELLKTVTSLGEELHREKRERSEAQASLDAAIEALWQARAERDSVVGALALVRDDELAAAGELMISLDLMPPGSTARRLMLANVALRRERDHARARASAPGDDG